MEIDYAESRKAINEGFYGADRWYEFHEKSIIRLRQLVAILENPEIQSGTQVKLRDGNDYTHLSRVLRGAGLPQLEGSDTLSILGNTNIPALD